MTNNDNPSKLLFALACLTSILWTSVSLAGNAQVALTPINLTQQWVSAISGLAVKPLYMLATLWLALFLRKGKGRDIILIRRGLWVFLLGELFCALNYLLSAGNNIFLETLHELGMVIAIPFILWGLFDMADKRVLGLIAPKIPCALKRFCEHCWKTEEAPCLAKRLLSLALAALMVFSLMPLTAAIKPFFQLSSVLGSTVAFSRPESLQLMEFRVLPLAAEFCFIVAFFLTFRDDETMDKVQLFLFVGVGFMLFPLFRLFLLNVYRETPVWSDFWEEITEFITVFGLGCFLYAYRDRLELSGNSSGENSDHG